MALSQRAKDWLATLSRETPMPTAEVERRIIDAGGTPHAVWLAFQDEYGGYFEEVGPGDFAIWGLARAATAEPPPSWREPNQVTLVPPTKWLPEAIVCAEVHPVHDYHLYADGRFAGIGGTVDSFAMKLEREGLMREFYGRGKVERTLITRESGKPEHQQLLAAMQYALVPEASNARRQFFLEPKRLLDYVPHLTQLVLYEVESGGPQPS